MGLSNPDSKLLPFIMWLIYRSSLRYLRDFYSVPTLYIKNIVISTLTLCPIIYMLTCYLDIFLTSLIVCLVPMSISKGTRSLLQNLLIPVLEQHIVKYI